MSLDDEDEEAEKQPMIVFYSFGKTNNAGMNSKLHLCFNAANLPDPSRAMKKHNGKNKDLQAELFADKRVVAFYENCVEEILKRVEAMNVDDEFAIDVGVCCLQGKHRSVAIVERLYQDQRFKAFATFKIHVELEEKKADEE